MEWASHIFLPQLRRLLEESLNYGSLIAEVCMTGVTPGIYRHFKGNLYFVFGLIFDGNDPTNEGKAFVQYHPLYQVENIGWRYRTPTDFTEQVVREGYSGPRFTKIEDLKEVPDSAGTIFDKLGIRGPGGTWSVSFTFWPQYSLVSK